jgi:protein-L-isoaspartate(D-aspartate) O-methyltransferase
MMRLRYRTKRSGTALAPGSQRDAGRATGEWALTLLLCGGLLLGTNVCRGNTAHYSAERAAMVDHLREYAQAHELGREELDYSVLAAMHRVPRHAFVPTALHDQAYENWPLPIGYGQTISQPYIVALMTDLLAVDSDDIVLEVGTGSGYQAAVLAELTAHVYTIEIVKPLARQAAKRLAELGYANVSTRIGDGYQGWPSHAPFDAIIVTAGADHVPPPLIRQLKPGGKMIIPVDSGLFSQDLTLVEKMPSGAVETRKLLPVRFVPLTGDH